MQGIVECYLQASKLRDWFPTNINSGNCQEQNNRVFLLSGTIGTVGAANSIQDLSHKPESLIGYLESCRIVNEHALNQNLDFRFS